MKELVGRLAAEHDLPDDDLLRLIEGRDGETADELCRCARAACDAEYGRQVFLRGLIEFTNYCGNDCLYCGIRRGNAKTQRYRLPQEEILACCESGYAAGLRTFVLQGGEDGHFTDDRLCAVVSAIKERYPDCAVTLSVGERSAESYLRLFRAGADRYLLRHETADEAHYAQLHPMEMSLENRMNCLRQLKEIGLQVGCGFMVGSPGQTARHLVKDLRFIKSFDPHMVGIGPFLPHKDTPFATCEAGSVDMTLYLLAIVRLLLPDVLLPATTALGTARADGQLMGLRAGANVLMPNISPESARDRYLLYDNKRIADGKTLERIGELRESLRREGFETASVRGDSSRVITH